MMETNYVTYTRVGKRLIHPSKRKHFDPSSKIVKMKKFSSIDQLVPKIRKEKMSPIIATEKGIIYFQSCVHGLIKSFLPLPPIELTLIRYFSGNVEIKNTDTKKKIYTTSAPKSKTLIKQRRFQKLMKILKKIKQKRKPMKPMQKVQTKSLDKEAMKTMKKAANKSYRVVNPDGSIKWGYKTATGLYQVSSHIEDKLSSLKAPVPMNCNGVMMEN